MSREYFERADVESLGEVSLKYLGPRMQNSLSLSNAMFLQSNEVMQDSSLHLRLFVYVRDCECRSLDLGEQGRRWRKRASLEPLGGAHVLSWRYIHRVTS